MSKDKELSSFRISDKRRPEVRTTGKKKGKAEEAPPAPERAFPEVEVRLEKGTIDDVAAELRQSYERLEALAEGTDLRSKGQAKKALAAYERTADLFEYLFATKDQLTKGP